MLYTLRFGKIVYGRGNTVVVGDEMSDDEETGSRENCYVFITAEFNEAALPERDAADANTHASMEAADQ